MEWKTIGKILLEHSYITPKIIDEVLKEQEKSGIFFGDYLLNNNLIRQMKINLALQEQSNLSSTSIEKYRYIPIESLQYTVIDILTTGINFEDNARICEFSIVKFKDGKPLSVTRKLVKLEVEFPVLLNNIFECAGNLKDAEQSLDYFIPILNQLLDNEIIISFSVPFVFDLSLIHISEPTRPY